MKVDQKRFVSAHLVNVRETLVPNNWVCRSPDSKNEWVVIKNEDGHYECSCPDFKRRIEACKHIIAVMVKNKEEVEVGDEEEMKRKERKVDDTNSDGKTILMGYDRWEVVSAFHKELRRGSFEDASYWLEVMMQGGLGAYYINNYISSIIGEELCCCDVSINVKIKSYLNREKIDEYALYAAVDLFCHSKKWWECERCTYRRDVWFKNRIKVKVGKKDKEIPFYALDIHTRRGKALYADGKADLRFAGMHVAMLWRRTCAEQGKNINETRWNEIEMPKEKLEWYKWLHDNF